MSTYINIKHIPKMLTERKTKTLNGLFNFHSNLSKKKRIINGYLLYVPEIKCKAKVY